MLPDGRVFIFGGIDSKGSLLRSVEIFDPQSQTFVSLASPEVVARAYHSATLLTDGNVLITGGSSTASDQAVLWDFRTSKFKVLPARLSNSRQKHKATLLSDGNVLLEGGVDAAGNQIATAELFDHVAGSFNFSNMSSARTEQNSTSFLVSSTPADGATDLPVDTFFGLRFSNQLSVETANRESFVLAGPEGSVAAKVVPAEAGRLVFVTPEVSLAPNTRYTLSMSGAVDVNGRTISPGAISFTTKANPIPTLTTDEEDWIPKTGNLKGDWRSNRPDSPWQKLPALLAEEGVTALAGQTLMLNGNPLENVTVSIDGNSTVTDQTGRFLLKNVSPGHHVLKVEGSSASKPGKVYGLFKIGVEVKKDSTSVLPFTIWMPRIDTKNATRITVPTTGEVALTTPYIPGLEVRIPSGAIIRDVDGNTVSQLSITPIPIDRPPFPLPPHLPVPVFFTVQPGAAQVIPPRARVVYPNYTGAPPGTRLDFWNYNPEGQGWYVYGKGSVSADGKQVVPDPGVVVYEFTGFMVSTGPGAPADGPPTGFGGGADFGGGGSGGSDQWPVPTSKSEGGGSGGPTGGGPVPATGPGRPKRPGKGRGGDPVDLATGLFILHETDVYLPDVLPIALNRTYRQADSTSRPFGIGSTHPYEIYLIGNTFPYTYMDVVLPEGGRVHFNRISPGTSWGDAVYEHTSSPSVFFKSQISWNGNGWDLKFRNGAVYTFPDSFLASQPRQAAVIGMRDRYGNALTLTRDANKNLTRITSPGGRFVDLTYDASNRIIQAKDNINRTVIYTYDTSGRLWKVTNQNGEITEYTYDSSHRLLTAKDERGIVYLTNEYDSNSRVIKQTLPDDTPGSTTDNPTYQFAYTLGPNGKVTQTDVTDPRGYVRRVTFNADGYTLTDRYAVGTPDEQSLTDTLQTGTNLLLGETDQTGRQISYTRDNDGFITELTSLAGTADATHVSFTYEPLFKQLTSVTGPLGHTVYFDYDNKGNLIKAKDLLNQETTFTYNSAGQLTAIFAPQNNVMQLFYVGGDLVSVADSHGRTSRRFLDAAGRLLSFTDTQGRTARLEYDAVDQLLKVTDSIAGETVFTYDPAGNLRSINAHGKTTSYTYDNANRVVTVTDPSLRAEHYEFDKIGNQVKFTDRRGVVVRSTYDAVNRLTFAGFGETSPGVYESSITYSYDSMDRLAQVNDSITGIISRGYNTRNQLTSETSPQGTVSYTYDTGGRLASRTVAGQSASTYAYDSVNRLQSITQGAAVVTFAYDPTGRLASLTLPNGVASEYSYNSEGFLTAIDYKKGTNTLGNLNYDYDAAGRRQKVSGTFARSGLPQSLASATYDGSNQLNQWGATTLTYDASGNLTNDGTRTYTWDARNQLRTISGPGLNASFKYDGFGRRAQKTINGVATEFLYDGLQPIQELSAGSPVANMFSGGLDQVFSRSDSTGTSYFITDFLGSTVGLTDAAGALRTEYTYDPFGQTSATGDASTNPYQYTGRENDGATGLYYYRNRYYSPTLQRFISPDPLGWNAGINFYSYVNNDPINFVDPLGLDKKRRGTTKTTDPLGGNGKNASDVIIAIIGTAIATVAVAGGGSGVGAAGGAGGAAAGIVLGALASSAILGANMALSGMARPLDTDAHHIAPGRDSRFPGARESREILEKFNIDINDPANGVYLPGSSSSSAPGANHPSLHTKVYYEELFRRLSQATTRDQVIQILNQIRQELLNNTFPH
jgi:RHS repeat-associated protein